jgi:hypothetical protein
MEGKEYIITRKILTELDALYDAKTDVTSKAQVHQYWGTLVEELRKLRHLVESGVTVKIEGSQTILSTWQEFYTWAHGRYHKLEEGSDKWIGNDD